MFCYDFSSGSYFFLLVLDGCVLPLESFPHLSIFLFITCYPINNRKIQLIQQHIVIGYLVRWRNPCATLGNFSFVSPISAYSQLPDILCICVTSHHHKFSSSHGTVHVLVSMDVSQEIEWKGKGDPTIRKRQQSGEKNWCSCWFFFSFSYFVLLWLGMSIELDGTEWNFVV